MDKIISKNLIEAVIVDNLWSNEVKSGRFGNYYWRIICTSDGTELNLCNSDNFDRWANSDYLVFDYEDCDYNNITERLYNLFNS